VLDRVSSINDLGVIMDEKMNFLQHIGFCNAGIYQKNIIRVQKFIQSEVSLHVFSSSEAGVRQLCMKPIL
jgi:hypothetical protein